MQRALALAVLSLSWWLSLAGDGGSARAQGVPAELEGSAPDPEGAAGGQSADGEEGPAITARAEIEVPLAADQSEDPTAAGSTVLVESREATGEGIQDVIEDAPGLRVVRSGSAGSFSGVSLRGAELSHTTVLLGTLPLSGPDTGTFDLDQIPLAALDRVEVYRGGAPLSLSSGAIGGIVRLMPRRGDEPTFGGRLTVGSFGLVRFYAFAEVVAETARSFVTVGGRGSEGDFLFTDDGEMPIATGDEIERRRENAQLIEGSGLARFEAEVAGGRLEGFLLGLGRIQGEPGPAADFARAAERRRSRFLGSLGWTYEDREVEHPFKLQLQFGGGVERNELDDRMDELGLRAGGTAADDVSRNLFGRAYGSVETLDWLDLSATLTLRSDAYGPDNDLATEAQPDPPSTSRVLPAIGLEARAHGRIEGVRFELRPSVRLEGSFASVEPESAEASSDEFLPTARLGAAVSPVSWLSLTGSVSTGRRLPSLVELFGDRVFLLPAPSLEPETSIGADVGAVARGEAGPVVGIAEARFFWLSVDDLIRYRRNSQFQAIAENLESGRILGVEGAFRGSVTEHLHLTGSLTWLDARDQLDRRLPLRPELQLLARAAGHTGEIAGWLEDAALFVEVRHRDAFFFDPANLQSSPDLQWVSVGASLRLWGGRVGVQLTVDDLFNQRGQDLLGYPLPGRRFALSIETAIPYRP